MEASKVRRMVATLRRHLNDGRFILPISTQQRASRKEVNPSEPCWVNSVELPLPEKENLRQSLFGIIKAMSEGHELFDPVDTAAVRAEWVGHCKAPDKLSVASSEAEKYDCLMKDTSSEVTLLYVHGGSFYRGSPAASRSATAKLAKLTGGRCLAVQYRVAPQTPFPGAVLDLLVAYHSLLHPLPGALHAPVPHSSIVLTGESSGANLCFSLLQVLLELGRQQKTPTPTLEWNGQQVPVPVPAGLASICVWADLTQSLPSWTNHSEYDLMESGPPRASQPGHATCAAWPTNPPRGDIYCDLSCLCHPLVSPCVAKDWTGAPPLLFLCGEERAADSNKLIAKRAWEQGCEVVWEQYEAMPHIFMLALERLPHSQFAFERWAGFCKRCVEGGGWVGSRGMFVEVETLRTRDVDVGNLTKLNVEEALVYMRAEQAKRRVFTGSARVKSML